MGFSATGSLLPGSMERPDQVTYRFSENRYGSSTTSMGTSVCKLNILGYIPVVSTITGLGRALLGIVHTIVHLVCAIFSHNRQHHLQEAGLGAKNIGRGIVEVIPIIGNIILFIVDLMRINKFEKMAMENIAHDIEAYNNHATKFIYGQEIAKRPIADVSAELDQLNRKPTLADLQRIVRNPN